MILSAKRLVASGALAAAVLFGTLQGAAAQARPMADPPAIAYRKSVMHQLVAQVWSLRALLSGDIGHLGDIRKHTEALLANTMMVGGLFPAATEGEDKGALREIWDRPDDFKARIRALQDEARALDAAAQDGERGLAAAHLQVLIGTCGGCHSNFKLPAALPPELASPL